MKLIFLGASSFYLDAVNSIWEEKQWEVQYVPMESALEKISEISANSQDIALLDAQAVGDDLFDVLSFHEREGSEESILLYNGDKIDLTDIVNGNPTQYSTIPELNGAPYKAPSKQTESKSNPNPLTPRERQVLWLICEELTNKEIGEKLEISQRTVDAHRRGLFRKIDADNTAGLVKHAIDKGIYEL